MTDARCPVCKSEDFFVKLSEDQFDVCEFCTKDGEIAFAPDADPADLPEITAETETYCSRCAWHGRYDSLGS